jgi:amino acid adenylation domain-containing protein
MTANVVSLLHQYATRQAEQRPDATALVLGEERLTYGDVERTSNRLAWLLKEAGCRRGDRVCLFTPKTPAAVVAMHGILKADAAYVPIDIASPASRVAKIVESAEPKLVLVASDAAALLSELAEAGAIGDGTLIASIDGCDLGRLEPSFALDTDLYSYPDDPIASASSPDDLAHILFTSGSTGTPKGVMITHANVVRFVEWATSYFETKPADRVSGHPPLHFDLSTFDIYGSFLAGAELHLVPAAANLMARKLADFIRDSELTQWFSVPSTMTFMAKSGVVDHGHFPALERVLWCGEVLPTPVLIHWMERLPHARFTNLYGPTEATIASSYYTVPERPADQTAPIPIGEACSGEELVVLDEELKQVPRGETGDLFIGGVGLSPGYWRDEGKTRAAFVSDPRSGGDRRIYRTGDLARVGDDGLFHFLGRADSQIKSRGYRIELGEIETALNAVEEIKECAVVGVDTEGFEGTAICCAYATREGAEIDPPAIRGQLAGLLPKYMIPSRFMAYDVLPKNVNGKIDRRTLRERFEETADGPAKPDRSAASGPPA